MKIGRVFIIGLSAVLLAGCNPYKINVDLTPDRISVLQEDITSLKREITAFVPSEDAVIPWQAMIDLSRSYEDLGDLGKAAKVYEDVLKDGHKTKAILNNLGRLYERMERYDEAISMYQRINDEYFDRDYLYDITWAYIRAGDRKNADKYFNAWQLEFTKTDEQVQQAIKKLREAEKAGAEPSS